ncbi:MAG: PAS domain S-box protein [Pseudomonadota bacterium]
MERRSGMPPAAASAPAGARAPGEGDMQRRLQELQLNQLELEMQSVALAELQQIKDDFESDLQRYARLYQLAPVSYLSIERGGRISRANVAAAALLGRSAADLLGRRFEQFIAPQSQAAFRGFIAAVFASGARQVLEAPLFEGVGGAWVRIEANLDRHADAASHSCRMIVTELGAMERGESALRRAFIILDNINEGVLVTDPGGRIVAVNPSFTAITGYQAEEAIGRNPRFLGAGLHPPAFYQELWAALARQGSWRGELINRKKNGERFVEWLSITTMRAAGGAIEHFVGVFSDITERKHAEVALREMHRELDRRVIERTAELTSANALLVQEIGRREQAQLALREAETFFHSTIDSLSQRVLVLDRDGAIMHVNRACMEFVGHAGGGANYLLHCETDPRWQHGAGRELAAGIGQVASGALGAFSLEYEFVRDGAASWFEVCVNRFLVEGPLRVVVAHTDITERKLMERALRQSHAQLRQLAIHLETAKEDERKRISRDIHDELGQNLLALRIDVSMLAARTGSTHPRLHRRVATVLGNVDLTIRSVRDIMNQLRPPVLDLGLQAAIEWQIGDFRKRSGIACQLRMQDEALLAGIGGDVEIVLFRVVQEGLHNVSRHSRASEAAVELRAAGGELLLSISDDGIGIAPAQRRSGCFGLIGMDERITALGGRFTVRQFREGQGCCLDIRIPLPGQASH